MLAVKHALFQLFVDLFDQRAHAVPQRGAKVRDHVAGDLLDEERDLVRVLSELLIHGGQSADVFTRGGMAAHGRDALLCDLALRRRVIIDLQRVAVAPEGLDLKRGIDERVARREGVALRSGQDRVFAELDGKLLHDLLQLARRAKLRGRLAHFRVGPRSDLARKEPAVQDSVLFSLFIIQRFCLFRQCFRRQYFIQLHIDLSFEICRIRCV